MVNELCELAASGMSVDRLLLLGFATLSVSCTLFILHKKGARVRWILPGLALVLMLAMPLQQAVSAQSVSNCSPAQANNQTSAPNEPDAIGGLINDNPELDLFYGPGNPPDFDGAEAAFQVLNNDQAPEGDPFDTSTLRLLGSHPDPTYAHSFFILDPNNSTLPIDPGFIGDPGWENVWGYWSLDLTCDVADVVNCLDSDPGPSVSPSCMSANGSGCWPDGTAYVYLAESAQPGTYTIQYSVKTQSGRLLNPATITVNIPSPPEPSPITAVDTGEIYMAAGQNCADNLFAENWSVNLMDFVSTTGPGTLLPATIDLDQYSPGIQSTVTEFSTTFTVDVNGVVTMTDPVGPTAFPRTGFNFTIQDSDGLTSNVASGLGIVMGSACN